jgi:hypothetical protein
VIALERAVALGYPWTYAAPLASGLGGLLVLLGFPAAGFAAMTLGAAVLVAATAAVVARQASLETLTLLGGAAAWLAGNALLAAGRPVDFAVPWWIAFFVLTIAAERLELSRYLPRSRASRILFAALAGATLAGAAWPALLGATLAAMSVWLLRHDIARATVRTAQLPRYIAVCLLAGYFWLALGGVLLAAGGARDAALHAVFIGFVFSMVLGHAPVILPAVLRVAFPYAAALYAPLAALHLSLACRLLGDALGLAAVSAAGAWGNAAAIALFIGTAAVLVLRRAR